MLTSRGKLAIVAVVLAVALMAGGFWVGRSTAQQAEWHSGTAYLMGGPDSPGFSVRVDGWAYGAEGSVPHWIDRSGALHDGGWPTCLRPPPPASSGDRSVPVRFAEVSVSAEDVSWRAVVMVDCLR